ncbi:MAG: alpha/beta hydrolase [Defluviitaleaceae bacterium]|nr:alpha/beta hydrolase [Defluviitaleaceae bacterium]
MATYRIKKNQVFFETDREYLTADIYIPNDSTNIPSIILIHGGAWIYGSVEDYTEWCMALAERGICAMSINYRLSTPTYHSYPGVIDDVEAAIKYLVKKASKWNLDPYNMGLIGDSVGAQLAFMTLFRHAYASSKIKLIVCAYGVYDLPKWLAYADEKWPDEKWPNQPSFVKNLIGKDPQKERGIYEAASPYHEIERAMSGNPLIDVDIFLTWGEDDGFVPQEQSIAFAEKLKNYEGRIRLKTMSLKGVGHLWFPRDTMCKLINPLDKYPLSEVAPSILEFISDSFKKPRFVPSNYIGKEDYLQSKTFRASYIRGDK